MNFLFEKKGNVDKMWNVFKDMCNSTGFVNGSLNWLITLKVQKTDLKYNTV